MFRLFAEDTMVFSLLRIGVHGINYNSLLRWICAKGTEDLFCSKIFAASYNSSTNADFF